VFAALPMWFDRAMVRAATLDHLVLVVADVERTMAWYQEHLGLDPMRLDEWRAGEVFFPSLRVTPETIIDVVPGHDGARGHLDHLCFVVDADELSEVRERSGLVIEDEGERFGARGMASSIYVRDPDGLLVELRAYPVG
jgi:catechol 2,3-dioxygenase-like lactoylglutathione lyase family enzyme